MLHKTYSDIIILNILSSIDVLIQSIVTNANKKISQIFEFL